jgi:serine/threonine protein kinase
MVWQPGKTLNNAQYIIKEILGEGGFGITYLATDTRNDNRDVAIKTLKDESKNSPNFPKLQDDFKKEAERLQRCTHPHIVKIYDLFLEENLWSIISLGLIQRNSILCMVMEYVPGEDLDSVIRSRGALQEAEALKYIQQVGKALKTVHEQGLLHRDIKPQNIMLRENKFAVLIDFGIAREFLEDMTLTHTVMLTPFFAPPEQFNAKAKRGTYTDIYALAATLYVLLIGGVPNDWTYGDKLEPPKKINSSISDRVSQAIIKGMEKKPEDRPQSVQQWLQMLVLQKELKPNLPPVPPVEKVNPWLWVSGTFAFWILVSSVSVNLPLFNSNAGTLEVASNRSVLLAFLAFPIAIFAPSSEIAFEAFERRPIACGLLGTIVGVLISIYDNFNNFLWLALIGALVGSLIGCILGVPSVILGIAKRDLQKYLNLNGFMTFIVLVGSSLLGVGLSWLIFAYPLQ